MKIASPGAAFPTPSPAATTATPDLPPLLACMPSALVLQFKTLEEWAQANLRDARWDAFRFWMLKIPAIVVSAGSGAFAYYKLNNVAVIAGAIASLCVLMDGLNPGGALRNVHRRAFNELRKLQDSMSSQWQVGELRGKEPKLLAAEIIENAGREKDRINAYITTAETSLASAPARPKGKAKGQSS